MTEQEIAETMNERRAVTGIEIAEEIVWQEYDSAYASWNASDSDGSIERVNELEQSLVALRVARELLSSGEFDDELLQSLATQVPCDDVDLEAIEETVAVFESYMEEERSGVSPPSGPSIDG